jgi:hypothetical protein
MRRALLLLTAILAGCSPEDEGPMPSIQWEHTLDVGKESDVSQFVGAHPSVKSLRIRFSGTPAGFGPLARLQGLEAISLSGFAVPDSVPQDKKGHFVFKACLTDADVKQIAEIPSLQSLQIWYGSLSPDQRSYLKHKLPRCRVFDNLNKL